VFNYTAHHLLFHFPYRTLTKLDPAAPFVRSGWLLLLQSSHVVNIAPAGIIPSNSAAPPTPLYTSPPPN